MCSFNHILYPSADLLQMFNNADDILIVSLFWCKFYWNVYRFGGVFYNAKEKKQNNWTSEKIANGGSWFYPFIPKICFSLFWKIAFLWDTKFSEPHNAVSYSNAMFPYGFEFAEIFEFGEKKTGPHYFQLKMMI